MKPLFLSKLIQQESWNAPRAPSLFASDRGLDETTTQKDKSKMEILDVSTPILCGAQAAILYNQETHLGCALGKKTSASSALTFSNLAQLRSIGM